MYVVVCDKKVICMRILLLAEKSLHTQRLVHYALAPHGYEISLLHWTPWSQQDIQDYLECGISSIEISPEPAQWEKAKTKIGKLYILYHDFSKLIRNFQPDVINIQYIHTLRTVIAVLSARHLQRFILSFWGSDLLRQNNVFCLYILYPLLLRRADAITFDSLTMIERMHQLYGKAYDHKIRLVRFPNPMIEQINTVRGQYACSEMRSHLGIPQDGRIIVVVGYSNIIQHNHLKITDAVASLSQETQKKLFLVYPMTYGQAGEDYIAGVDTARKKLHCESVILREFLTEDECAFLYLSSDIFIHAQTSDAYSQSFVDYIYAGATVFQADWLHYPEIDRYGLNLYEFSDYPQLTKLLKAYLDDYPNRCLKQSAAAIDALYKTESPAQITKKMKSIMEGEQDGTDSTV